MDFVTGLSVSINWKRDSYNSILVIVDCFTKMVHYKQVKIILHTPKLGEVIIDVVIYHHGLSDSIVTNKGSFFTSKFWLSLCYFLSIKQKLSIAFLPQTDSQTHWQNSTIEAYLQTFINFEQNDWAKLLSINKFTFNNAKNSSNGYTSFELSYGYYPGVSFEKDTNPRSWSNSTDKLLAELRDLMTICRENLHHAQEF